MLLISTIPSIFQYFCYPHYLTIPLLFNQIGAKKVLTSQ